MPKVQEYLPETEAQGPVGQTSPLVEQVSEAGRGIQSLGRDVTDAFNLVHQRQTMAESSDAYASVSEQRAMMMQKVQQQQQDGTLDVDKIKQEQQDWIDKQSDNYDTAGGKDAFNRAASRMQGAILVHAASAQSAMIGKQAQEDFQGMSNNDSAVIRNDPTQFGDLRDNAFEYIQSQKNWSPAVKAQIQKATDIEMSKAATFGIMDSDYANIKAQVINSGGKIDPNTPELNKAKKFLDEGHLDQYMDAATKEQMYNAIKGNQSAAQTAGWQVLQQKKMAIDAEGEAWKDKSYDAIKAGNYSPDDGQKAYQAGLITTEEKQKFEHLATQAVAAELKSDPAIKNQLMARVNLPDNAPGHISNPMDVALYVKSGSISMHDFQDIRQAIQLRDHASAYSESQLMDQARAAIGENDPDAEYKLSLFSKDILKAKQNAIQTKQPIGPLLDKNSPQYLGNNIKNYVATPQQLLSNQADQARGQFVPAAAVQTAPGVAPSSGAPVAKTPAPEEIGSMAINDLKKLDPKVLSPSQREAARVRYNQLSRGK